jgi:hypothetical protein
VAIASFLEDPQTPGEKEVCFFHSLWSREQSERSICWAIH